VDKCVNCKCQVKLCDPSLTRAILSILQVSLHETALCKCRPKCQCPCCAC